ncbi:MAG: AraC family transcriptional regulator [Oscillospiraceae bacterium]|nr:AraC family transcriptional regulator [Oscillospiraceae bacterium]
MNTLERLNAVIDYVEKHITEKLDLNRIAEIACYSLYDFQRMFGFIAEMTIVEYIRKRRLTLAGLDLKHKNAKVIDTALKFGYESPVSFARAFQIFHGVTPSEAKKSDVSLKIFPRLMFQIIVKEVPQVIRTDNMQINGKEYEASYFGKQDMSSWTDDYKSREFWRLENAYNDFKDKWKTGNLLPYTNYPMNIETGQVFVIDYTGNDGTVKRKYHFSDGTVWLDMLSTTEFRIESPNIIRTDKITVNDKIYEASYFGEHDMTSWSDEVASMKFWRLENAYDDFKDNKKTDFLPYSKYPMSIEPEQVFVIDYIDYEGALQRKYYISDRTVWQDMPSTTEFMLE